MIGGVLVQSETPQNEHRGTRPGQYRDVALQRNWYGRRWKNPGHAKKRQYLRRPLGPPSHRLDYGDLTPQAFPARETLTHKKLLQTVWDLTTPMKQRSCG